MGPGHCWTWVLLGVVCSARQTVRIVGLFEPGDGPLEAAFLRAVDDVNNDSHLLPDVILHGLVVSLRKGDSFSATRKVCTALRRGVAAVLGPRSPSAAAHVQSICDVLEVPHVQTRWDLGGRRQDYAVNLHPHPGSLSQAYLDLLHHWHWRDFSVLYETEQGLMRLQAVLRASGLNQFDFSIRQLPPHDSDYRSLLKRIKKGGSTKLLLDCSLPVVQNVLKQAQEVGMMNQYFSYLIVSLNVHTLKLEEFTHTGTNITGLSLLHRRSPSSDGSNSPQRTAEQPDQTEAALFYDAVKVVAHAVEEFGRFLRVRPLSCESEQAWTQGSSLLNFIRLVRLTGETGPVQFDRRGLRTNFTLAIEELSRNGLAPVGRWTPQHGVNYTRSYGDKLQQIEQSLRNKTLVVITTVNEPYVMLVDNSSSRKTGNARFEGFCIDLVNDIARLRDFSVRFKLVEGGSYGGVDPETGEASGMVKELMEQRADMAVGDLTISYEREQVLDFTMPWMNLGISILYTTPQKETPELFSFLAPLSLEVWLFMAASYVGVSVLLFILARFSPYEWDNPHPCREEPDVLENQFSLANSLWFTIGSLMQQGSDIAPKALSTRMVAGLWWFFTLIMISSYTANLAAFLTVERMVSPIESAEDLAKQTDIKYGALKSGATKNFFRDSKIASYQRMWSFMQSTQPSPLVQSGREGVERVKKSNGRYAYFMESPQLEYVVERNCQLQQVGGLLDTKSYGIALPPGSPYTSTISTAILILQENGTLHNMKLKWWTGGGGICKRDAKQGSVAASELNLDHVGGVFVVLLAGMAVACGIAIGEFVWKTRELYSGAQVSLCGEMARELRCTLRCRGSSQRPCHLAVVAPLALEDASDLAVPPPPPDEHGTTWPCRHPHLTDTARPGRASTPT